MQLSRKLLTHKNKQFPLFLLIASLHLLIIVGSILHQSNKPNTTVIKQTFIQLTFIDQPKALPKKAVNKPAVTLFKSMPITKSLVSTPSKVASKFVVDGAISQTDTAESSATNLESKLNLDVKNISQSVKKEFDKGDQLKGSNRYDAFHSSLSSQNFAKQNGIQVKEVFAPDGRPISKVTTPFGTYCVRHYKPGERLEMTPPSFAVSCGTN